mmetsp:Transcript_110796/g.269279  ORF Transcript_110796/g.269279 Transcript_110796/m.269279 type:complete len:154 (-) Transcript_110796:56-517(-)
MSISDCSDLRNFPTLIIKAGGHKLHLPPSSYLGTLSGAPSAQVAQYMHLEKQPVNGAACQLLLMDLGQQTTTLGPLVILGMPLFREYYTTFDLGRPQLGQERKMFAVPAGDQCQPAERTHQGFNYQRQRSPILPRRVDVSQVQLPRRWLRRLL